MTFRAVQVTAPVTPPVGNLARAAPIEAGSSVSGGIGRYGLDLAMPRGGHQRCVITAGERLGHVVTVSPARRHKHAAVADRFSDRLRSSVSRCAPHFAAQVKLGSVVYCSRIIEPTGCRSPVS
jgi:hypothetical protein